MTSVLRRYGQLDPRLRYFYTIADSSGYTFDSSVPTSGTVALSSLEGKVQATAKIDTGTFLKDLGRAVHVYNQSKPGYPQVAIFRQVQFVDGIDTEGIGSGTTRWIVSWLASGSTRYNPPGASIPDFVLAKVARTG